MTSYLKLILAVSLLAAAPPVATAADRQPDICGYVTYCDHTPSGIYHIPTASGQNFENITLYEVSRPRGAVMIGDRYYLAEMIDDGILGGEQYFIHTFDAETWQPIGEPRPAEFTMMASDVALDPATGIVYGCFTKEYETSTGEVKAFRFGTIDYEKMTVSHIADLEKPIVSMAIDSDGTLYAISGDNRLVTIDKATGEMTDIGSTGVPFYDGTILWNVSAVIDPATGKLYSTHCTITSGSLYEINKTTGRAKKVVSFPYGELVLGLFIPGPESDADAPAAADFSIGTDRDSLQGTLRFTIPSLSYSGSQLSNSVDWNLTFGSGLTVSGSGMPGEQVVKTITVPEEGEYNFTLVLSNQAGESPKAQAAVYFGNDTPRRPENLTAQYANGGFSLTWSEVTSGIHNGYLDLNDLSYSVVRHPDELTVAEGLRETSLTDILEIPSELTVYSYSVVASASGKRSAPAVSERIALGEINPPYFPDFSADGALEQFTIIDANGDSRSWRTDKGMLTIPTSFESDADDWAITPPIHLEKDKSYRLTFAAASASTERFETLEVKLGRAPSVEAMTETILPSTVVKASTEAPLRTEYIIRPEADGAYYIGFHGQSRVGTMFLYVFDVDLTAGMKDNAPSAPSDLKALPAAGASVSATISFTAPELTLGGDPLGSLTKAEVYCNRAHVATLTDLAPGRSVSFENTPGSEAGVYTYRVVVYSEDGPGMPADCSLFLGVNLPAEVCNLKAVETDGDGEVAISWEAPRTDIDGYYIRPEIISYDLYDAYDQQNPELVASGLTEPGYSYRYCSPGARQDLAQWMVIPKTSAGYGTPALTDYLSVGQPYEAPYEESFTGGGVHHIVYSSIINGTEMWDIKDESFGIAPQDADGGYATFPGGFTNYSAALVHGKVRLPAENPGIIFYSFNIEGGIENENLISVEVNDGSGWKPVKTKLMKELPLVNGWTPVVASLEEYAGKVVTSRFVATIKNYATVLLDNIYIGSLADFSVAPVAVRTVESAAYGEPYDVDVWVANKGVADGRDFTLTLLRDGKDLTTIEPEYDAAATEYTRYVFSDVVSPGEEGSIRYSARIDSKSDADLSDNLSSETSVSVVREIYPAVRDLAAEMAGDAVDLSWNAPDFEDFIIPVTETFEEAEPFAINNVAGWSFVDADGGETYGINGWDFPNNRQPMAYIVFDTDQVPDYVVDKEWYAAHSGTRYLVSMAAKPSPTVDNNDDWLISPELSGDAQTITFFAKSIDVAYGYEQFEVYVSYGDTEISSFVNISGRYPAMVPQGWTKFSFELPEGARHFAIRCISPDCHALFIDDITYTPAEPTDLLELLGYDVWRDGRRLTDTPITETTYTDIPGDCEPHTYHVTAVYNFGKSRPSDAVVGQVSSVYDAGAETVAIRAVGGCVEISGLASGVVEIFTPDGTCVARSTATGTLLRIPLPEGIYIVSTPSKVRKLII